MLWAIEMHDCNWKVRLAVEIALDGVLSGRNHVRYQSIMHLYSYTLTVFRTWRDYKLAWTSPSCVLSPSSSRWVVVLHGISLSHMPGRETIVPFYS
jgi:hypothetical protein